MKSGLEFMKIISLDGVDAKRKFVNDIVNKVNGISLIMLLIDF